MLLRRRAAARARSPWASVKAGWDNRPLAIAVVSAVSFAVGAVMPLLVDIAPHDLRRTTAKLCRAAGGELEQIQLLLGHSSVQTTERYLGTKQDLVHAPNDAIKLKLAV